MLFMVFPSSLQFLHHKINGVPYHVLILRYCKVRYPFPRRVRVFLYIREPRGLTIHSRTLDLARKIDRAGRFSTGLAGAWITGCSSLFVSWECPVAPEVADAVSLRSSRLHFRLISWFVV